MPPSKWVVSSSKWEKIQVVFSDAMLKAHSLETASVADNLTTQVLVA
jgi:hypothetical protein